MKYTWFILFFSFFLHSELSFSIQHKKSNSPRTVMVQLFEWPWQDIAKECEEYLGPNGFAAVQVSPPQEHLVTGQNYWWERYQPVSYQLISRSGSQSEFQDMVRRCQRAGVDIYVDLVANHMAGLAQGVGFGGTRYRKYDHTGLYTFSDFHHCGRNGNDQIVNFKDRYEVQFCELLGLADLKTDSDHVQNQIAGYMRNLLDVGVTGFRLDAAKHIPATDLSQILSRVGRAAYYVSETFIGLDEPVQIDEYLPFSDVNVFQFPFQVGSIFRSGKIHQLSRMFNSYPASESSVIFIENHDLQRMGSNTILSYLQTPNEYFLAHVFMLTWPYGYPQIFSGYFFSDYNEGPPVDQNGFTKPIMVKGQCQAPWGCEHRLSWMASLVKFRNFTNPVFQATDVWAVNENQIAYGRGSLGFVVINGADQVLNAQLRTSLRNGVYCNVLDSSYNAKTQSCPSGYEVKSGYLNVSLPRKSALVLQNGTRVMK